MIKRTLLLVSCLFLFAGVMANSQCGPVQEDRSVYTSFFDPNNGRNILSMQMTTSKPPEGYTWADILADRSKYDTFNPYVLCAITISGTTLNCTAERRGDWSMESPLPSLKVKFAAAGTWKNMDRVLLNKHPWDTSRVRNKLSYEILQKIPNLVSLYTQFVQLTVDGQYYGLYTLVEDIDKNMLKTHNIGANSWLYKANEVTWDLAIDTGVKLKTDPTYTKDSFEVNWDLRGNSDHTQLIKLYNDMNNANLDSYTAMTDNWDVDNFASWLAFVYLIGDYDMETNNFAIYAPQPNTTCAAPTAFYMVNWDNDGGWDDFYFKDSTPGVDYSFSEEGIQYMWRIKPVERFLRVDSFVDLFVSKMTSIYNNYMLQSTLQNNYVTPYKTTIRPILSKAPDVSNIAWSATIDEWSLNADFMTSIPERQFGFWTTRYLNRPMSINMWFTYAPTDKSSLFFFWEPSYVLYNKPFYYDFAVSTVNTFSSTVYTKIVNNSDTWIAIPTSTFQASKTYFWRVIIRNYINPSVNFQVTLQVVGSKYGIGKFTTPSPIPALTTVAAKTITNTATVSEGGVTYYYATIDNLSPDATTTSACSTAAYPLPAGYILAPNNAQTRTHIKTIAKQWGTTSLVLADGNRVNPVTGLLQDGFSAGYDSLIVKVLAGNKFGYAANCVNAKKVVLIRRV